MKGATKSKLVTSGRLSGRVKPQVVRKRVALNLRSPALPEPTYSLYSTDSEDQVASLHQGLDWCTTLLGGILNAEGADGVESPPVTAKGGKGKSKLTQSQEKISKKPLTQTGQRNTQSVRQGSGSPARRTPRSTGTPPAHSGVKLHPPHRRHQALPQRSTASPTPLSGDALDQDDDQIPVRDVDTHRGSVGVQVSRGVDKELQDTNTSTKPDLPGKMVQWGVLGELKALIAGQGSVAERLISHLEQTVSSPQLDLSASNLQTEPDLAALHSQNAQLQSYVMILHQQLKEREDPKNIQTPSNSQVTALQEQLSIAQSRVQVLQRDLTELQRAHQETQARLQDTEAENTHIRTDLEAIKHRLLDNEREKKELASLAQQRLEEIECLKRTLKSHKSLECSPEANSSTKTSCEPPRLRPEAADLPLSRISQYLQSLGQAEPAHTSTHPHLAQKPCLSKGRSSMASVLSDWSESTFDTRDEAAFRDSLQALDASIASLQKTIQQDMQR